MYQSRWGFHPCDYATYHKLKFLKHVYLRALRMARNWERWQRKDPHNRVIRRRIRNAKGQTIGYELPTPRQEPCLCPVFTQKFLKVRYLDKKGNVVKEGFAAPKVVTDDFGVAADYAAARKPEKDAAEVRKLRLSIEMIDALVDRAQTWLASQ
jgi:hypothetical protein